ncbi:protein D2-like [Hyposmocoma kahamanoa]|uniref:protein D2-like n=1 Tax=Hyposmocoma kahamanoa TaxID=1477025 RepID=UPI000E6D9B64|nr:protein D2-like [Hyposmocoma kahamanoa]
MGIKFKVSVLILAVCNIVCGELPEYYFKSHNVVPDVIERWPDTMASVVYSNRAVATKGHELTPSQTKTAPAVKWNAFPQYYYTLAMVDPDAPSRVTPIYREWLHWLVINIPGDNVAAADVIANYNGPSPPKNTGLHRYVILVYKQPGRINFNELYLDDTNPSKRANFSIAKFARKSNLQVPPVAGDFFMAQYENNK